MTQQDAARPESMAPNAVIDWARNSLDLATQKSDEARYIWKTTKFYQGGLTKLLACLQELRTNKSPDWEEEAEEIVDTWMDILGAMEELRTGKFPDPDTMPTIEDWYAEIIATPEGREAHENRLKEEAAFKAAYLFHKSRLGLKSQKAVAELTGIDRRYISVIERGDHKPQFKTLKTLADGFGVDVSDLMSDKYLR